MTDRVLTIEVQSLDEEIEEVASALEAAEEDRPTEPQDKLVFRSIDDVRSVLTQKRLGLLHLIREHEPDSVYALAELAGRDRKSVTVDLELLERLGLVVLERVRGEGRDRNVPRVPYAEIRIAVPV